MRANRLAGEARSRHRDDDLVKLHRAQHLALKQRRSDRPYLAHTSNPRLLVDRRSGVNGSDRAGLLQSVAMNPRHAAALALVSWYLLGLLFLPAILLGCAAQGPAYETVPIVQTKSAVR